MNDPDNSSVEISKAAVETERNELLQRLKDWLEMPMLILAFVWLLLLLRELIWGEKLSLGIIATIIWAVFIVNFLVEFVLAPHKIAYFKSNWLTAISLLIPAVRIFRIFRLFRLFRLARVGGGLRLVRIISSVNRSMHALEANLRRRGFGYVVALSLLVTFAGAAGMYAFEREINGGLNSYGDALWWTAMVMTTMGSQFWPETFEGRILCLFLALYAFAIFGYMTATIASFFIGRDAENDEAEVAGTKELVLLRQELLALRNEIRTLSPRSPEP